MSTKGNGEFSALNRTKTDVKAVQGNTVLKRAVETAAKLSAQKYAPKSMFLSSFYGRSAISERQDGTADFHEVR